LWRSDDERNRRNASDRMLFAWEYLRGCG
jgi:hypothetical protein